MLVALAALIGLLDARGSALSPDVRGAILRPLRLAERAAQQARSRAAPRDPSETARLRLRFLLLCRVTAELLRRLRRPDPGASAAFAATRVPPAGCCSPLAAAAPDTS